MRSILAAFIAAALLLGYGASAEESKKPPVEIGYGLSALPEPVKEMLLGIGEAIRSGNIDDLKVAIEMNEIPPVIDASDSKDPLAYLKSVVKDDTGAEVLAKLSLILDAGYAHVDKGGKDESYVWPYLAEIDLKALTPADRVRLHRIAPGEAGVAMEKAGTYTGWRISISATGVWHVLETGSKAASAAQPAAP
ncbi:MAG: hypothetical protein U1E49_18415 [Hyphomicrobiaceae bacterium]